MERVRMKGWAGDRKRWAGARDRKRWAGAGDRKRWAGAGVLKWTFSFSNINICRIVLCYSYYGTYTI